MPLQPSTVREPSKESDVVAVLGTLITKLGTDEGAVRRFRDSFDAKKQYELITESTGRAYPEFDHEFRKFEHHAQTIRDCREAIVVIEGYYSGAHRSCAHELWKLLQEDGASRTLCQEVEEMAEEAIRYLDNVMKEQTGFEVFLVYKLLRNLLIVLENWRIRAEDQRKAHEYAAHTVPRGEE
jgi:hypothetical protein